MELPIIADRSKCVWFEDNKVVILDRRRLPHDIVYLNFYNYEEVAKAIEDMVIQGAPPIALAAGYGLTLAAYQHKDRPKEELKSILIAATERFKKTRPTGADLHLFLSHLLEKGLKAVDAGEDVVSVLKRLVDAELRYMDEVARKCGENASLLLLDGDTILTHCFPGPALVYMLLAAKKEGKKVKVFATETRPYLQGAKLTSMAVRDIGLPLTLITDNMVGYCMWKGLIKKVFVAADRIALDGSIANKVGTYMCAIVAKHHDVPFYVLGYEGADPNTKSFKEIPIEERDPKEIFYMAESRIPPEGIEGYYPAFDITPPELITAIITCKGIYKPNEISKCVREGGHLANF